MRNRFNSQMFEYAVRGIITERSFHSITERSDIKVFGSDREGVLVVEALQEPKLADLPEYASLSDDSKRMVKDRFASTMVMRQAEIALLVSTIRKWLDDCDIIFSGSEVRYGEHEGKDGKFLRVRVQYPVVA